MPHAIRRDFRGDEDLDAIIDLRVKIEAQEPTGRATSRERLRQNYQLQLTGWKRDFDLWERDNRLVGCLETIVVTEQSASPVVYLRVRVDPDESDESLLETMLDRGEQRARAEYSGAFEIETSSSPAAVSRVRVLERRGYTVDRVFHQMAMLFTASIALPVPKPGYRLRPLKGAEEVDAWLAVYENSFQDHHDFHPIAREDRIKWLSESAYLPEFDLVIESDSGDLAAFCVIDRRVDDEGAVAWHVDLIGTHREHRRRGLAEWLLLESFAMIRARGGERVSLEVDSTSPTGANRLYERLGFTLERESVDYRKALPSP
jgi:ribosomal protein S18 acetylase RimI-like enzyme